MEGTSLQFRDGGVSYGEPYEDLQDAQRELVGGKVYGSLEEAFNDISKGDDDDE